jgi:ribosomal subunit interface protein
MRQPVQIGFHGFESSAALEEAIHGKLKHLERFSDEIVSCRVGVELLQKHQHQGRPFGVRIDLTIPGHELVVSGVQHEDVYVALRDAFDDMKRQLEDAVRRRRGAEKHHAGESRDEVLRRDREAGALIANGGS